MKEISKVHYEILLQTVTINTCKCPEVFFHEKINSKVTRFKRVPVFDNVGSIGSDEGCTC